MAGAAVLVSFLIFLAIAPFARTALPPVAAFIPVYQTALVTNDLITAVLLMGQYSFLRSRALLVLGAGYLFCAFMAVAHALSFPGLFAPSGVLGAGPQTTAWLYFLWHGGFPLFVLAYVWLKERGAAESAAKETAQATGAARSGIVLAASGALALTLVLVLLTTVGHDALPVLMRGNQDDTGKLRVAFFTWTLSLVALVCLWRKARSVLDLWLMVTLVAWLLDIALAAVLNGARFDLGFYGGRVYGLLASSFVLIVLLLENSRMYADLAHANVRERQRNHADSTSKHFLDLFHHRLLTLFYRAWASAQPTVSLDRPGADRFAGYLGALIGIGMPSLQARDSVADVAKLHFAGRLGPQTRNAEGLAGLLSDCLGLPVAVEPFVGHWMDLRERDGLRLGSRGQLGQDAVLGHRVWDRQHKFRLQLGPLSLSDYGDLLPQTRGLALLAAAVRNYAGLEYDWDLRLLLGADSVPRLALGGSQRLGYSSWLGRRHSTLVAGDLVLAAPPCISPSGLTVTGKAGHRGPIAVGGWHGQ